MFELQPAGVKALTADAALRYLSEGIALDGLSVVIRHDSTSSTASVIRHWRGLTLWEQRVTHRGSVRDVHRVAAIQDLAARWALDWLTPARSVRSHPANRVYRVQLVGGEVLSCRAQRPRGARLHAHCVIGAQARCEEYSA